MHFIMALTGVEGMTLSCFSAIALILISCKRTAPSASL